MNCSSTRTRSLLSGVVAMLAVSGCSQRDARESRNQPPIAARATDQAPSSASAALREQLIIAMSGYEFIVGKSDLDRLGSPDALVEALSAIYADPTVRLNVRIQSLASLRFFPTPEAKTTLEAALVAPETTDVIRRSAIKAYGVGFRDDAVANIAHYLEHPDLHTRNAAARSLSDLHTQRALAVLRLRLPLEKESLVKSTIQNGLDRVR